MTPLLYTVYMPYNEPRSCSRRVAARRLPSKLTAAAACASFCACGSAVSCLHLLLRLVSFYFIFIFVVPLLSLLFFFFFVFLSGFLGRFEGDGPGLDGEMQQGGGDGGHGGDPSEGRPGSVAGIEPEAFRPSFVDVN